MSSVHTRCDVRVFVKECCGLAAEGFSVTLIVADGLGGAESHGVLVRDVGRPRGGRLGRILVAAGRVYMAARRQRADLYHCHDPELLPWALLLRLQGYRVVYDAHEHVPHDILSKPYLGAAVARVVAVVIGAFELFAAAQMSAVVAATPDIGERFAKRARRCIGVFNFPLLEELSRPTPWAVRGQRACYVGLISSIRGVRELAAAAAIARTQFVLAGPLQEGVDSPEITSLPGWERVQYVGVLGRPQVADLMASCRVGIVTFLPELNHVNSLPNKLFEYMSAGLPVVASNFPGWRAIVEGVGCGLCVDPTDAHAVAAAVDRLASDAALAQDCGERGARAVRAKFNWSSQLETLVQGYRVLLST